MNTLIKLTLAILFLLLLCNGQTPNKVWVQNEGCAPNIYGTADGCFYFMEDLETHTRCYAFRALYHDGAAISCVKQ